MDNKLNVKLDEERVNPFAYLRSKVIENGEPISIRRLDALMGGIIGYSHISELESGKRLPSLNQLKVYHNFFNVSYEFLLGEIDVPDIQLKDSRPGINNIIDEAVFQLANSKQNIDREKWKILHKLLTTDKGKLLLFYLVELFKTEHRVSIYKKIDSLLSQDDTLSYNELIISVKNEVTDYE